jgi:alpha-L-rhamnosidase
MSNTFVERVFLHADPFESSATSWYDRGKWPAQWIGHPDAPAHKPVILGFRRQFNLDKSATFIAHVTADERYELFLNGVQIGRGSEHGDRHNWFYESYSITLPPGAHLLCARTWHLGSDGLSSCSQISIRAGFLFAAEDPDLHFLSTGKPGWECALLGGYKILRPNPELSFAGGRFEIDGNKLDWNFATAASFSHWSPALALGMGRNANSAIECSDNTWRLRPATLPAMLESPVNASVIRHIAQTDSFENEDKPILLSESLSSESIVWKEFIEDNRPLSIPPNTGRRILLDLKNYHCAYPEITVTGGKGTRFRLAWAEALYSNKHTDKGNRDEIEGKYFRGVADYFLSDGGVERLYTPLDWMAGRYIELTIITGAETATLNKLSLRDTHYPYHWESDFDCADEKLNALAPLFKRSLEMCSHEIYMDCPYYERLMYAGDTRLEILQSYTQTRDDRLVKKSIRLFDESRLVCGLTQSRYPSRMNQLIAPFSLWWIGMVHDFLYWRNDPAFVRERMTGVRAVLEAVRSHLRDDSLVHSLPGWNFVDWVPGWKDGIPPENPGGVHTVINLQAILALEQGADLERSCGDDELAKRNETTARNLLNAVVSQFWDESKGLIADDVSHQKFSEHTQSLAILTRGLDDRYIQAISKTLSQQDQNQNKLVTATIYFSHYLLEAYAKAKLGDCIMKKLDFWKQLPRSGFKTTPESPEPSRSDCHGWGSHPLYHYFSSILGIRPGSAGFGSVIIKPQLSTLAYANGRMPHPLGMIEVDFKNTGGALNGRIRLPNGLRGTLLYQGDSLALKEGLTIL